VRPARSLALPRPASTPLLRLDSATMSSADLATMCVPPSSKAHVCAKHSLSLRSYGRGADASPDACCGHAEAALTCASAPMALEDSYAHQLLMGPVKKSAGTPRETLSGSQRRERQPWRFVRGMERAWPTAHCAVCEVALFGSLHCCSQRLAVAPTGCTSTESTDGSGGGHRAAAGTAFTPFASRDAHAQAPPPPLDSGGRKQLRRARSDLYAARRAAPQPSGTQDLVCALEFHPEGDLLLSAGVNKQLHVYATREHSAGSATGVAATPIKVHHTAAKLASATWCPWLNGVATVSDYDGVVTQVRSVAVAGPG